MVLICGHGGRDQRCGIIGPVLRSEFQEKLSAKDIDVHTGPVQIAAEEEVVQIEGISQPENAKIGARIGLISHIGGHKFAGNVIIYIPPNMKTVTGEKHPLAGHGIWYGRIEPKHVEGIVQQTILEGNVVEDKFRGGIDPQRRILRI